MNPFHAPLELAMGLIIIILHELICLMHMARHRFAIIMRCIGFVLKKELK